MPSRSFIFPIEDISRVGEVRRFAQNLAESIEMDEVQSGRLAIVINEMGSNVLKHAQRGDMILRILAPQGGSQRQGVEIIAIDRGPGIADLDRSFADGYSTVATSGTGLGAIRRQADGFDIYSRPNKGTCLVALIFKDAATADNTRADRFEYSAVCLPLFSETVSGDSWAVVNKNHATYVIIADGLGHGPKAHEASTAAVCAFDEFAATNTEGLGLDVALSRLHGHLRTTRGAAVMLAQIPELSEDLKFIGCGNIRGLLWHLGAGQGLVTNHGTVGLQLRPAPVLRKDFSSGDLLMLASDGLSTRWDLTDYPGLATRHPAVIAGVLYRDFCRHRDDATIVVGRKMQA